MVAAGKAAAKGKQEVQPELTEPTIPDRKDEPPPPPQEPEEKVGKARLRMSSKL